VNDRTNERPARADERCTCGRTATVVYLTATFGEVPYCGTPNPAPAALEDRLAEITPQGEEL
jgi:hypothetical protein